MKTRILTRITIGIVALTATVRAEEGGAGHYISGLYTDFSGFPPTAPGLYVANYFLDYHDGTFNAGRELPIGGVLAAGVTANLQAEVPVALYAYPCTCMDVTFSSGLAIPIIWSSVKVDATFDALHTQLSAGKRQSASGLGDMQFIPIMAGWTNGDFKLGAMANVWAPTGKYTAGQLANSGMGYWTFEPLLAFSWLSSKIGTEFSLYTAVDFNTQNNTTDYKSGDVFHVDATLAQHLPLFGGIIGVGASGFFVQQITGDSGSGARLGDFETQSYGVGPTLSYVHAIGKHTLVADLSWLPQLHSDKTTKGSYFWAKITFAF
jgi:hypothetical protein